MSNKPISNTKKSINQFSISKKHGIENLTMKQPARHAKQGIAGGLSHLAKYIIILPILLVVLLWGIKLFGGSVQAVWSPIHGNWLKRQQLNVYNSSTVTLHANTPIAISIDTKTLYTTGKLRSDCNDIRIIYQPSDTVHTELSRYLVYPTGTTCGTSTATKVYFNLQADLSTVTASTSYYLYFNNPQATAPSNSDNAFDMGSADALLVCPFSGSTTCAAGETPSTESGAIRYSQGKSALQFDGFTDDAVNLGSNTSLDELPTGNMTIEGWLKREVQNNNYPYIASKGWLLRMAGSATPGYLDFIVPYSTTSARTYSINTTSSTWFHFAIVWNATTKSSDIYINGVLSNLSKSAGDGTYTSDQATNMILAGTASTNYKGLMDEIRISNIIRYSSNFTPQTSPFVRDEFTKLLLHFDENGDDPRQTGKALDDSGNSNHGTITGAKYVNGLVGVDTSSSSVLGNIQSASYAGHEGVFIEEGTTNKITNPSFENSTYNTNWSAGANNTVSDNTTLPYYKFGTHSTKIINAVSADTYTTSINVGNTNPHTLSAYVYDGTSGNVGGTVSSSIVKVVFNGVAYAADSYVDQGGGWWRLSYKTNAGSSSQNYGIEVQAGKTIYVDGVQLEEKAYTTTYADGSLGTGYAWTGTENNSTSTRTESNLQYTTTNNLSASSGTVSFWLKMKHDVSDGGYHTWLFDTRATGNAQSDGTNGYTAFLQSNNLYFRNFGSSSSSTYYATFTGYTDSWKYITLVWTGNKVNKIYINGVDSTTGAGGSETTTSLGTALHIGDARTQTSTYETNGSISDFRAYSTALTSDQVIDLYQSGLMSRQETGQTVTIDRFDDNKGQNPLSVYHMDEGYGTTVNDSTTNLNHLTLSGATWIKNQSLGTSNSSLSFDGTNDYLSRSFDQDYNFDTNTFTLSGLFRHPSTISGTDTILSRQSGSVGYKVYMNSSGYLCFSVNSDSACTEGSVADSKWHHFSAVRGSTTLTVYVDGKQASQTTGLTATTVNGTNTLYIGVDSDGASNYFDGFLDEIYIYPSARTSAQVLTDYNSHALALIGSRNNDNLTDGLVGWWKMDESSWSGAANEVVDSSGNGNNGTAVSGATTVAGKYGNGGSFDGTDDYVTTSIAFTSANAITFSAWVYPDSAINANKPVVGPSFNNCAGSAWGAGLGSSYAGFGINLNMNDGKCHWAIGTAPSTSVWSHVVGIYDGKKFNYYLNGILATTSMGYHDSGTNKTETEYIGTFTTTINRLGGTNAIGNYMDGKLDDVRVYNRALSASEVYQLYESAPGPVAHWTFDEGSGSSAYDKSGNGNTGTLTNGPTWISGKYGKALSFDGSDDFVNLTSTVTPGQNATYCAWSKWTSGDGAVLGQTTAGRYVLLHYSNGTSIYSMNESGSQDYWSTSINNNWHNLCMTLTNNTTIELFIDGISQGTKTPSIAGSFWIGTIGRGSTYYFKGTIDDVKIYNYVRSRKQIVQDMIGSGQTVTAGGGSTTTGSKPSAPIAYYKFDEGQGTTANNAGSGGNTLNGTLTNMSSPATATSGWTNSGKFGKGVVFDGSDDYISIPDNNGIDLTNNFSISLWFKPSNLTQSSKYLVSKQNSDLTDNVYAILWEYVNNQVEFYSGSYTGTNPRTGSGITVSDTNWHHIVYSYNGTSWEGYLDSIKKFSLAVTFSLNTSTANLLLGEYDGVGGYYFYGGLDEVKIYNYALSADEVKLDYNRGSSMVLGSISTDSDGITSSNADSRGYCVPGDTSTCNAPVAEWSFDEGSGLSAYDRSGNSNTGTLTGGPVWTNGKYGKSLIFDGSDDSVTFSTISYTNAQAWTVGFWIYSTSDKNVMPLGKGLLDNSYIATYFSLDRIYVRNTSGQMDYVDATININQWHFISVTAAGDGNFKVYVDGIYKGSNTPGAAGTVIDFARLGHAYQAWGSWALQGKIDQVRIYNYARTPAQIAWDCNRGGPVGWWKLDECQGTTAYDASGNSNNGTITIGATLPQSSAGNCSDGQTTSAWFNGKIGKVNSSTKLDGVDDFISIPTMNLSTWSVGVWAKMSALPSLAGFLVSKDNYVMDGSILSDGTVRLQSTSGNNYIDSVTKITDTNWHHYVFSTNGTNTYIYIDGKLDQSGTKTVTTGSGAINVGRRITDTNYYFSGQVDDVRVYNYALTPLQIKTLYGGGAVRFGN